MKSNAVKIFFLILAMVILAIGTFAYLQWNKPHNKAEDEDTITMTSNALFQAYEQNEKAANEKYLNKAITVTGEIMTTEYNQDDCQVLMLRGNLPSEVDNNFPKVVMCTMRKGHKSLPTGAEVSVVGYCTGFTGDVHLSDCVLSNPYVPEDDSH